MAQIFDRIVQRLATDRRLRSLTWVAVVVLFLCLLCTVGWIATIPPAPEGKGARPTPASQQAPLPSQTEPAAKAEEPSGMLSVGEEGFLGVNGAPAIPVSVTREIHSEVWKAITAHDTYGLVQLQLAGLMTWIPSGTRGLLIDTAGFLPPVIQVRVLEGPNVGFAGWTDYNCIHRRMVGGGSATQGNAGYTLGAPPGAYANDYVPPKPEVPSPCEIADVAGRLPYRRPHETVKQFGGGERFQRYGSMLSQPRGSSSPAVTRDVPPGLQQATNVALPSPFPIRGPNTPAGRVIQGSSNPPAYSSSKAGAGYPGGYQSKTVRQPPLCRCGRRMLVGIGVYYCPSCKRQIPRRD